jgi:hypothetical protein
MVVINERYIYEGFLFDKMIVVRQDIDRAPHLLRMHVADMNIETNIPIVLQQMNRYRISVLDSSKMI